MTFLVAPEQVAIRMGLEGLDALSDDRQETLLASLRAASTHLALYLRHETFDLQDEADTFLLRADDQTPECGGLRLALRRGFVVDGLVDVQLASSLAGLTGASDVAPEDLYVDSALGVANIFSSRSFSSSAFAPMRGYYFARASYSAGFDTTGSGATLTYVDVPVWLQEAATIITLFAYKTGLDCEEANTADLIQACGLTALLSSKLRWIPGAALPLVR